MEVYKNMISNQYQNQMSFQGNLLKQGIKLPEKKFREVAKIYAEKTEGKPDLTLVGHIENSDFDGQFYHSTTVFRGNNDIASMLTRSLKNMFDLPSKKVAEELINLSRKFDPEDKANILKKEINDTKKRLMTVKLQLEQNQTEAVAKNLRVIAQRMDESIATKQKMLAKVEIPPVSGEWC